MAFGKRMIERAPIERWVDDTKPEIVAWEQDGKAIVEYGSNTARGFVQVPFEQIDGVVAALTAMRAGKLAAEGK